MKKATFTPLTPALPRTLLTVTLMYMALLATPWTCEKAIESLVIARSGRNSRTLIGGGDRTLFALFSGSSSTCPRESAVITMLCRPGVVWTEPQVTTMFRDSPGRRFVTVMLPR
ncbi:hypothetical protein DSECCO2_635080 [anaerobic digester metagenome]